MEFAFSERFNLFNNARIVFEVQVALETPDGVDSDIAVGISDEATVLFFINDREFGSSVFAANTTINNDLPSYVDANQGAFPFQVLEEMSSALYLT